MYIYTQRKGKQDIEEISVLLFIVALFTIVKIWKQHKCPLIDEWIKKMWNITHTHTHTHTHVMEYYSAMRKTEILPFVTIYMELEDVLLNQISHTQKDNAV